MHSSGKWIEGFAIRILSGDISGIWIIRRFNADVVTLASIEGGNPILVAVDKLEEKYIAKDLIFLAEMRCNGELVFNQLSEKDQEETTRKYAYVKEYLAASSNRRSKTRLIKIISDVARKIEDKDPPGWTTLNNWIKQYINAGNKLRGLFPLHDNKGNYVTKLDDRVREIINAVKPLYYKPGRLLISTIHKMVEGKIIEHNLSNPSDTLDIPVYSTVKYHVERVSYQEYIRGRVGRQRAKYELAKVGVAPKTSRILERVEADHTNLDIHVLHDDRKTLLGRPTLTALIDHYSGMIVGFQISFEEPSFASASMAISNAVLLKASVLAAFGIEGHWPAHGVMESMVADNGSEFWSGNMDIAIGDVGSVLQYAPVRSPNYKGRIERFFLTLKTGLLDALPGKTNGVGAGSKEYNPQSEAKLTLSEFKKIFLNWLVNIYHLQPVGSEIKSPLDLWIESEKYFPVPIEDAKRIETILMATDTRTLQREGIQIENLKYNSDSLKDIYRRDGRVLLTIKYSHFNLGYIYVYDSLNLLYLKVPCDEFEYANNLSLYAHKIIVNHSNSQRKSYKYNATLLKAKAEVFANLDALHEKNVRRKSQVTTKRAARVAQLGGQMPEPSMPSAADPEPIYIEDNVSSNDTDEWEVW